MRFAQYSGLTIFLILNDDSHVLRAVKLYALKQVIGVLGRLSNTTVRVPIAFAICTRAEQGNIFAIGRVNGISAVEKYGVVHSGFILFGNIFCVHTRDAIASNRSVVAGHTARNLIFVGEFAFFQPV